MPSKFHASAEVRRASRRRAFADFFIEREDAYTNNGETSCGGVVELGKRSARGNGIPVRALATLSDDLAAEVKYCMEEVSGWRWAYSTSAR